MAKAKAKYADLVKPLRLWTELVRPSYRGKLADLNLLYDKTVQPKTKIWVETFYAYAPGEGVAVPGGLQYIMEGKPMKELWEGGQHSHREYDELFLYYGSDPADNTRLGGEVEFWMGHGKDAEKFVIDEPTAFWVPKNVAHNPWIVTKVKDPKHPVMSTVIAFAPTYTLESGVTDNYPLPPSFSKEMIGKPLPGKGKYTKYANRLLLSQTILIPNLRGRVCVPNLMFDDKVFHAPCWVEMFLVYAGGQGVGVPNLEFSPPHNGKPGWDNTKGMQHAQNFDELFLFVGTDPHDTLNLGGEVVTYLGDEAYSITKASSVWVPAGVPHNPQYYKRVDRPFYMIVIALCDNAKFFEGMTSRTPAPKTFKF